MHRDHGMLPSGLAGLALALAVVTASAGAQNIPDDLEIQVVPVAGNVHMLVGAGGNIGVSSGEDGVFLIDDQYAPLTEKIRAAVKSISDGEIRFLLNTHWHGDHTGGNENFGKAGTVIVAHDNVRERMSVDHFSEAFNREIKASPKAALPVVTFNDEVTFHLNGDRIHAFHVPPAHTDGDSVVYFKEADVVHMGDLFFNGMYPFVDAESGGSLDGVIAACGKVLAMTTASTKIIPGHGPLAGRSDLIAYVEVLEKIRDAVGAHVDAGKTVEEVLEAAPTKEWDEKWGGGFLNPESFTRVIYGVIKKDRSAS